MKLDELSDVIPWAERLLDDSLTRFGRICQLGLDDEKCLTLSSRITGMSSTRRLRPGSPSSQGTLLTQEQVGGRLSRDGRFNGVPAYVLDVPETIPQLGYATHQFFRYYGKFPSVVGREIVLKFSSRGGRVLDCYAGSGTTLLEAQIHGATSFGIDINPLGVFAANLKTQLHDFARLREALERLMHLIANIKNPVVPSGPGQAKLTKWFTDGAILDLGRIKGALLQMEPSPERDFLTLAFLAVIRRTSTAFDGEVRPHVNPKKKTRPPLRAFIGKVEDMIAGSRELLDLRPEFVPSYSVIGDNRDPSSYAVLGGEHADLLVAHPPYLNSFNYLQVYSLEFMWSEGFESVWQGWTPDQIKALEHRAWPATNEALRRQYYEDFRAAIKSAIANVRSGGVAAVVIGDATIRGELEPVHRVFWHSLSDFLQPIEIWFRTTHYGIGKYAYRNRADYHGEGVKRDVVMFFGT